ncbi:MAG: thioesterase family protein [Anaerolineae bacterium]|nr:acyl-CoA thioesterase [Anaerolineae bacterium]MDW8299891.1 thioesterase family protein [Anaerolineae bacterium]
MSTAPRAFEISMPIVIRTYDIDFAGIVSNIVYLRWLEDMRLMWLERFMPLQPMVERNQGPVLVATHIEYKRPLRMFDPVIGHLWLAELGRARFTVAAEFTRNGEVTTTAVQHGVFVDFTTMRPLPAPEALRREFEALRQQSEGAQ